MSAVVIEDRVSIPGWVDDLESFRRWAHLDEFPEQGRFAFLNSTVWVDLSREELFSHNQLKGSYSFTIQGLLQSEPLGRFVLDRMLLTNLAADLSTEPDGLYYCWETLQSGRLRLIQGAEAGIVELEGTPDLVIEVISRSSVRKDTVVLRELYHRAGIPEFWLANGLGESPKFEILRYAADGYYSVVEIDGWLRSEVLGKEFRLVRRADPLGHPLYVLEMR